jgi:transcriptional regulator with XRE-family HTH domain
VSRKRKVERARTVRALLERAGWNQCEGARQLGVAERSMRRYVSLDPEAGIEMPATKFRLLEILTADAESSPPAPRKPST